MTTTKVDVNEFSLYSNSKKKKNEIIKLYKKYAVKNNIYFKEDCSNKNMFKSCNNIVNIIYYTKTIMVVEQK